jgi:hypothetical protein
MYFDLSWCLVVFSKCVGAYTILSIDEGSQVVVQANNNQRFHNILSIDEQAGSNFYYLIAVARE